MMHMRVAFFSTALGLSTSMTVLLPQRETAGQIGMEGATAQGLPPVLYLLHGASDDDTIWTRRTSIERYASEAGLAVVMPDAKLSFYNNEPHGYRYWDHVSDELPRLVAESFQVSTAREDTFVAGLSMGGFGAMKLALNQPERFAAAASLSGALDMAGADVNAEGNEWLARVWGPEGIPQGSPNDVQGLLSTVDKASLPKLWVGCGTEDFLFEDNEAFIKAAEDAGVELTVSITGGAHTWDLWDREIAKVIEWLPLRHRPQSPPA
ncbi:alpha/beta hydrolase [Aestuariimicrobium ganziense]|uniref:alpha/beta hydrolase n=1 Tax=Aestuariimicrobium ganziense TaxID=2773677 RepID=UPI0019455744|nr:alpha/beta hydrolase family protein [Aestuariimicrobium ganziense]